MYYIININHGDSVCGPYKTLSDAEDALFLMDDDGWIIVKETAQD